MVTGYPLQNPYKKALYKTELCQTWLKYRGKCKYGEHCQYAHGPMELRTITRHPRYKTEQCFSYFFRGYCSYGSRCNFIHDECQKLLNVDSSFSLMLDPNQSMNASNFHFNPDAPAFTPYFKNNEESESLYADSTYTTDPAEMTHEFLSDSGYEHNISSDDSGISSFRYIFPSSEPFTGAGFTTAAEFMKKCSDVSSDECSER